MAARAAFAVLLLAAHAEAQAPSSPTDTPLPSADAPLPPSHDPTPSRDTTPSQLSPQAPSLHLIYTRGTGVERCPDATSLRAAVRTQLGRDPFADDAAETLSADVRRSRGQVRAHIELRDDTGALRGARELVGFDCDELAPALTLAIALVVDSLRATPAPEPPPLPPVMYVEQAWDDELPTVRLPIDPRWQRWMVSLGAVLAIDASARVAAGIDIEADYEVAPPLTVGIEFRGDLPSTYQAPAEPVTSSLWTGTIVPCWRHKIASLCGLVTLGLEQAEMNVAPTVLSLSAFYLAIGGRIAVELPVVHGFLLRVHADIATPLLPHHLDQVQPGGTTIALYSTPSVTSAFGLAAVARFP